MPQKGNLWTSAEYNIVRNHSLSEAAIRLPHRTKMAIRSARVKLRVGPRIRRWTKGEERRLRKYSGEPVCQLAKRFKNRTPESVRHHRMALGLTTAKGRPWKITDLARLRKLYPTATRSELIAAFPMRTFIAIRDQAETQGFRKERKVAFAYNEYLEAVRKRAREDGISLGK